MSSIEGFQLSQSIRRKVEEMKSLCEEFVGAISEYHMAFHIKHMREVLDALRIK
jgi:hypothetical protein